MRQPQVLRLQLQQPLCHVGDVALELLQIRGSLLQHLLHA